MATRQTDLQRDMVFGQAHLLMALPDEDMKENTDYIIRTLRIAYRTRRVLLGKYNQISIRYRRTSGTPTEFEKIMNGQSKAEIYIYEFPDAYVICRLKDIKALLQEKKFEIVSNHDKTTEAAYINLTQLNHLAIWK